MGFLIFVPFILIDLVVATVLMSMGMMMMPPMTISLPLENPAVRAGGWLVAHRAFAHHQFRFVRARIAAPGAARTFMNPEFAVQLMKTMIWQAVILAAPFLGVAMLLGLVVSLFQAVTSINEHTLSFVPKALCVLGLLLLLAPWMVRQLVEFTAAILLKIPEMAL